MLSLYEHQRTPQKKVSSEGYTMDKVKMPDWVLRWSSTPRPNWQIYVSNIMQERPKLRFKILCCLICFHQLLLQQENMIHSICRPDRLVTSFFFESNFNLGQLDSRRWQVCEFWRWPWIHQIDPYVLSVVLQVPWEESEFCSHEAWFSKDLLVSSGCV